MTDALKQAGLPGFPAAKNATKNGKRADPAAFGDALRSAGNKDKAADKAAADSLQRAMAKIAITPNAKAAASDKIVRNDDEHAEKHDKLKLEREEQKADETDNAGESAAPMVVAADVVVQFTAALELLRQGTGEDEQKEEPEAASKAEAVPEPDAERVEKKDNSAVKAADAEPTVPAETAEPATAKTPVASVAADAAVEIDGVKTIAVQTQTTAPVAATTQLLVSTQLSKDTGKAEGGATRPADSAKSGDSRLTTIDTTAPAKVPAASEASADGQIDQNPDDGQNAAPETRRVEPAAIQSRAGVFVDPAAPVAAPPAPSVNANAITNAIAGVEGLRPGTETVAQMLLRLSSSHGGQVQSLKIQLHPAELGVVTAQLNFAGDQLSVELKVENAEAYHRLSLDTETIAKSLRTLGFDVDQVSIQQPQMVTAASARADIGGNSAGSFGRDASSFQSWGSSNGESGTGGQAAGRGRENGGGRHETHAPVRQNSAGSDIYI